MIVILGRSGSGKTTAANLFIERYPWYEKAVTITTRPKRDGEVNGKDYLFVDEDYFALLCKNNFFMETNEYRGWLYGTPKSAYRGNKISIITPAGLRQLRQNGYAPMSILIDVDRGSCLKAVIDRGDNIDEAYRRNLSDEGMFDGIYREVDSVISNYGMKKPATEIADEIYNRIYTGEKDGKEIHN